MPTYDSSKFTPPAPLAYVSLRVPASAVILTDVPMLMDTGADVSLVPASAAEHLNAISPDQRSYELMSFDGTTTQSRVAHLEMIFLKQTFRGDFLIVEGNWGIIGRNILNAVPLLFNGPLLTWEPFVPEI